jgi:hypothetical protein
VDEFGRERLFGYPALGWVRDGPRELGNKEGAIGGWRRHARVGREVGKRHAVEAERVAGRDSIWVDRRQGLDRLGFETRNRARWVAIKSERNGRYEGSSVEREGLREPLPADDHLDWDTGRYAHRPCVVESSPKSRIDRQVDSGGAGDEGKARIGQLVRREQEKARLRGKSRVLGDRDVEDRYALARAWCDRAVPAAEPGYDCGVQHLGREGEAIQTRVGRCGHADHGAMERDHLIRLELGVGIGWASKAER